MAQAKLGEFGDMVAIELTEPLPSTGVADSTYKIEGSVKVLGIGAPPFVYARIRFKEWYKPEFAEEVKYERAIPKPVTGDFSIDFKPEKEGDYEVTIVATPALLPLPVIGVSPEVGESDVMKIDVGSKPPAVFRFAGIRIDGNDISLGDHDVDSGLLLDKKTTDSLDIVPAFEWTGPSKSATISIKVGFRDWKGGFTPKTSAYTRTFTLPESPTVPYSGELAEAIKVPLTACGDISDGAVEIVAKLPDMPDYISHIWNVYRTTPALKPAFRFTVITIDGHGIELTNKDADAGLLLKKTTADSLAIKPTHEWRGMEKAATISIKAGYRDWAGAFTPKSGAYTHSFRLPESLEKFTEQTLDEPIIVPLVACGGLTDGAVEVVLKIDGFDDYISRIWNVYSTKEAAPQTLQVDITPSEGGYVTTEPQATEGHPEEMWYNDDTGKFTYGTKVRVEAHPNPGYEFDHWSDEIEGGVSYNNPENVAGVMDEHRAVKCHFREIEEALQTLEIDITPSGGGYVTTDPPPEVGPSKWYDGSTGKFIYGTKVRVEAHPNPGYRFDHWSDEIEGGTSYSNPEYVSGAMTEHKAVKCHFREIEQELQTLEVDITPAEGGYVTTNPPPEVGPEKWYNGSTGKFKYGERVQVTAHANPNYVFDHWSDEIEGGGYYETAYVSGVMDSHKAVKCHFREITTYTLTTHVEPYNGGTVTPSSGKYPDGEYVTLVATPAGDFDFDHWSGDASGITAQTGVYMNSNKDVTAHFKSKMPGPDTIVTFLVDTIGEPFATSYILLYHYDTHGNMDWQDGIMHPPADKIRVTAASGGILSCFCCSSITGEWGEQKWSNPFGAVDGEEYQYDIASGMVYGPL